MCLLAGQRPAGCASQSTKRRQRMLSLADGQSQSERNRANGFSILPNLVACLDFAAVLLAHFAAVCLYARPVAFAKGTREFAEGLEAGALDHPTGNGP